MMRTILTGVVIGAFCVTVGFVSKGDGKGDPVPPSPGVERPAPNPDEPAANSDEPTANPDQPAANPDGPRVSSSGSGTDTTGGQGTGGKGGKNPPGDHKACTDVCASLQGCADSCADFCSDSPSMVPQACLPQATALRDCALRTGVACDNNGKVAIMGDGCKAETDAFIQCMAANAMTGSRIEPPTP